MKWASAATKSAWEEDAGAVLPIPWEKLGKVIYPRGGNTGIIISAPGVGKTTFLINWAAKTGMRVLFISADTSPHDATAQLASLATGYQRRLVEKNLEESALLRREYSRAIMEKFPNLVMDFSQRPSMEAIKLKVAALTELWGEPPDMVVMDTASNVAMDDMANNANWQAIWLDAISIAREFGLFFVFAHHVRQGLSRTGRVAPEINDGLWGSDQFPEFVIGLHQPREGEVVATVRKNRGGMKDVPVPLVARMSYASIEDPFDG